MYSVHPTQQWASCTLTKLYKKYYKKGILNERLNKILENDQIELIKKYIKQDK